MVKYAALSRSLTWFRLHLSTGLHFSGDANSGVPCQHYKRRPPGHMKAEWVPLCLVVQLLTALLHH
jgi:hypothetical protein